MLQLVHGLVDAFRDRRCTCLKSAAVRGKLAFCGSHSPVLAVFELAGFTSVASFYTGRDDAVAALA